jgi:5-histidylcysteine sulfoxide synthase/putative 4-mercaptohistidine N1-methyltranferase
MNNSRKKTISLEPISLNQTTKEEIKEYFINSYTIYEELFASINSAKHFLINPDPLRRPMIFYLGHTASLYVNKIKMINLSSPVNEFYERLFATGVDPIYKEELDHENYHPHWPTLEQVKDYRREVYGRVLEIIDKSDLILPINKDSEFWMILLTIEHERIHLETTTLLIRQMNPEYLRIPEGWEYAPFDEINYPKNEFIDVKKTEVILGKPDDFPTFGWDNEYGKLPTIIKPFRASKFKISNGEYLEFVNSGNFEKKDFWTEEGWVWKNLTNVKHPRFWVPDEQSPCKFKYRALFTFLKMPMNWPVDVTYHEATAYANWKGEMDSCKYRMIKEGEFKAIRGDDKLNSAKNPLDTKCDFVAFSSLNENTGNVNMLYASSSPVDFFKPSELGFYDTFGNVWEWSDDFFRPFNGFKPQVFYPDFSVPCFDFYHTIILGSSWASTGLSASIYSRIAFRRHFYQNCGFRLVQETVEDEQELVSSNVYEHDKCVSEYISSFYYENNIFNYGVKEFDLNVNYDSDFSTKAAEYGIEYFKKLNPNLDNSKNYSALDLGCGVGKASFVLAKFFQNVVGLDYSRQFIKVCELLRLNGELEYEYVSSGDHKKKAIAKIDESIDRSRIKFMVGDAMNLKHPFGPFDLIIGANLIDRLPNPIEVLSNCHEMLNNKGILLLLSPYTWLEQFTDRKYWIGGGGIGGDNDTFEVLKNIMDSFCFDLVAEKNVTLLIREHGRKFQLCISHMTVWKKKTVNEEFATSIFKKI